MNWKSVICCCFGWFLSEIVMTTRKTDFQFIISLHLGDNHIYNVMFFIPIWLFLWKKKTEYDQVYEQERKLTLLQLLMILLLFAIHSCYLGFIYILKCIPNLPIKSKLFAQISNVLFILPLFWKACEFHIHEEQIVQLILLWRVKNTMASIT